MISKQPYIDPLDNIGNVPNQKIKPKNRYYDDDGYDEFDDDDFDDYEDDNYDLDIPMDDDFDDFDNHGKYNPDDFFNPEKSTSDDLDFGSNIGVGACFDDGPELGSEEIALNREYIVSASARAFTSAIQQANLSMGCKRAFQQVIDANFNKDIFLAYISNATVCKLNLKLALSHVSLSCIPHDITQPEYVQLKTNILEAFPYVISRGIGGRERYYQGLHRSESRSGESIDTFAPEKKEKQPVKSGWRNLLKR